jgi:hypothetical protein
MKRSKSTVLLKSAGIGRVLLWLLRFALVFDGFSTILTLIKISLPATPPIITSLQQLRTVPWIAIPLICVSLAILPLSMEWIYHLHKDLRQCYGSYPIDPWKAVIRFIVPIYNIWGIWKTLMTIARHFKVEGGHLRRHGLFLQRLVPVMYGIFTAYYLLDHLRYRYTGSGWDRPIINIPDSLIPVVITGQKILNLGMVFVLLAIAQTIVNAMKLKVLQIRNTENKDFSTYFP